MKLNSFINEMINMGLEEDRIVIVKNYVCPVCGEQHEETCWLDDEPAIDYFIDNWEIDNFDFTKEVKHENYKWGASETVTYYITIQGEEHECDFCSQSSFVEAESYADAYDNDEWRQLCFHHGLAAFYKESSLEAGVNRIFEITPEMEICCSTEQVGPFGITCSGRVLLASDADMWSVIDANNFKRLVDEYSINQVVDIDDLYDIVGDHNEIIMSNIQIEGIWVKPYVDKNIKAMLMDIANSLNVVYYEVSNRH